MKKITSNENFIVLENVNISLDVDFSWLLNLIKYSIIWMFSTLENLNHKLIKTDLFN